MEAVYRKRLLKLAKFLREKVPNRLLDMKVYLQADVRGHLHKRARIECKTPACALGWATAAFRELKYDCEDDMVVDRNGREAGEFFFGVGV